MDTFTPAEIEAIAKFEAFQQALRSGKGYPPDYDREALRSARRKGYRIQRPDRLILSD